MVDRSDAVIIERRAFIKTLGVGAVGLAACSGSDPDTDGGDVDGGSVTPDADSIDAGEVFRDASMPSDGAVDVAPSPDAGPHDAALDAGPDRPVTVVDRDFGYGQWRSNGESDRLLDLRRAFWDVQNAGDPQNPYPAIATGARDSVLLGGTWRGHVSLTNERNTNYLNSAALFLRDSPGVTLRELRMISASGGFWDGIRLRGSPNATIDGCLIEDPRDDAVENDDGTDLLISDSLFRRCFMGVSLGEAGMGDYRGRTITFDNTIVHMLPRLDRGVMDHASPWKQFDQSPRLVFRDSIFAITKPDHREQNRVQRAMQAVTSSAGSYFLNLSDTPLSRDYPNGGGLSLVTDHMTLLQGAAAREFFDAAESAWLADHPLY